MDRRGFLAGAGLAAAAFASASEGAGETPRSRSSSLAGFLADQLAGTDFGGTILVAQQGHVQRFAFGPAERAFGTPCRDDTLYRIASITKLMTAAMVSRLVDLGRLGLEQPIGALLPNYRGEGASAVTVRQLLNHTSGIENYDRGLTGFAEAMRAGMPAYQTLQTPRELMDRFASGPLRNPPGSVFDYNNGDYVILGQIIEAVEGAPFDEALRTHVVEPLAMTQTAMASEAVTPRLASTYYRDGQGPLINDLPVYPQNWYSAGGLRSSADDLLRFAQGLYGGRLVSNTALEGMLKPGLDEYGHGQWVSSMSVGAETHRFAQRPGRIMGANTLLLRMLDDDLTIVILANTNLVDTDRLGFRTARWVLTHSG